MRKEAYIHIVITRVSHWLTRQALQFACIWLVGEQINVGVVHMGDYTHRYVRIMYSLQRRHFEIFHEHNIKFDFIINFFL